MTTREALVAARALIATPDRWLRDKNIGVGVRPDGERVFSPGWAVRWATLGELHRPFELAVRALEASAQTVDLHSWNCAPERTHAEVLAAFDGAIGAAS